MKHKASFIYPHINLFWYSSFLCVDPGFHLISFSFCLESILNIFYSISLLENKFCVFLEGGQGVLKSTCFDLFLKDIFNGYKMYVKSFCPFSTFKLSMVIPYFCSSGHNVSFFPLTTFEVSSIMSSMTFRNLITMCLYVIFFVFIMLWFVEFFYLFIYRFHQIWKLWGHYFFKYFFYTFFPFLIIHMLDHLIFFHMLLQLYSLPPRPHKHTHFFLFLFWLKFILLCI